MNHCTCIIRGCDKGAVKRGWCGMHYRRWQRHGDPLHLERVRLPGSIEERFMARVRVDTASGCWVWLGKLRNDGYGTWADENGRTIHAYRWAYRHFVGTYPLGYCLDHRCRNRACVNPRHLEPVTNRENLARGEGFVGRNLRKVACPRGHAYDKVTKRGHRRCSTCDRELAAMRRRSAA